MKDRFSSLDIAVQVKELQSLIGSRLSNVYELGPRMFLFKIGAQMVIIESGVRIHTTTFSRAYTDLGGFCTKLRKHLKNKRLSTIMQLGGDRRMVLKFGDGDFQFNVVVEFYAQGNIILTDHTTKVLTFLRAHDGIQVGTKYDFPGEYIPYTITKDKIVDNFRQIINTWEGRKKKNLKIAMRSAFGKIYGPSLCDYALQIAGLNECEISRFVEESSDEFQRLLSALQECDELIKECINSPGGFIKFVAHEEYQEFVEFQPFKPLEGEILEYDSFNLAVDSYFTQLEIQKSQDKIRQAERQALKKLESVKLNAENQVKGYNISRKEKEMMAKCIEDNVDLVDACCKTVSTLVAGGMHWEDINVFEH